MRPALFFVLVIAAGNPVTTGCSKSTETSQPPAAPSATPAPAGDKDEAGKQPSTVGSPAAPTQEAPPTEAPEPAAPNSEPPVAPAVSDPERKALEEAFAERTCILKRRDRDGSVALDQRLGFKDAADFASRWAKAAASDPAWAETAMAKAHTADCTRQ